MAAEALSTELLSKRLVALAFCAEIANSTHDIAHDRAVPSSVVVVHFADPELGGGVGMALTRTRI